MQSLARSCFLSLAFVSSWSHAAAPDPSLVGCWRAVKIVQHAQGAPEVEDTSGRCTLQFKDDQLASTCQTASGTVTSTYGYRIVRPGFYSATMTGSTYKTDLIGSTREYEYHVDGDRLATATNLQTTVPGAPTVTVRVETEAERTPCVR
jgi:hypothetical protein